MNIRNSRTGTVASIHLHSTEGGGPLTSVESVELVEMKGLRGDKRYFGRRSRSTGEPTKRQVTLIERETLVAHATALELGSIAPGVARSNFETTGIDLIAAVGRQLRIGAAVLEVVEARTPCAKMDAIAPGLRQRMEPPGQGILARVVTTGIVHVGDVVEVL
jgi:MOSC domain-containing protein YiiM